MRFAKTSRHRAFVVSFDIDLVAAMPRRDLAAPVLRGLRNVTVPPSRGWA